MLSSYSNNIHSLCGTLSVVLSLWYSLCGTRLDYDTETVPEYLRYV